MIRAAAASNPSIQDDVCNLASADLSPLVRSAVAENPAIDLGRLTHLSLDPDRECVRARPPTLPPSPLLALLAPTRTASCELR